MSLTKRENSFDRRKWAVIACQPKKDPSTINKISGKMYTAIHSQRLTKTRKTQQQHHSLEDLLISDLWM